jgi:DNA-binding SARP family transcriptional activator
MARFRLRTLGGLTLVRVDELSEQTVLADSKALLVVAILATRPGYAARRLDLAELLWPEADRSRALRALRQALFFLSRHADEILLRDEATVRLDTEVLAVDVWEFDRAVAAADHARAIALYHGRFAAGFERKVGVELEHWIEAVDARVAVGIEVAYTHEIARATAAGEARRAAALARALVTRDPLDEERQRLLARTLVAAGDRVGALQTLEEYRALVVGDLEEEPSPELERRLQAMRDELLRIPASPSAPHPPAPPSPPSAEPAGAPAITVFGYPVSRTLLLATGGTLLVALVTVFALSRPRRLPADPFADLQGKLLASVQSGSQPQVVQLTIHGATTDRAERGDLDTHDLPSPDGSLIAGTVPSPDGWNLAVRHGADDPRTLTVAAGDEYPVAWSPDSRYILYARRRLLEDGRTEAHSLALYDLAADRTRELTSLTSRNPPAATWSPDGTRIAFTADVQGVSEIFVVQFNGANLRDLSRHSAWDGDPAWSPDGERIAFVSRRGSTEDLYSVRPDGGDLVRLTQTGNPKRQPVWLSSTALVFLAGAEGDRTLYALDTFTGEARALDRSDRFAALVAPLGRRPSWIAQLAITPRLGVGSPGEYLDLGIAITGPAGDTLPADNLPITWHVSDRRIARLAGPGQLQLLAPGHTAVVADAAGWRADTLALLSVALVRRPATPVFVEDWRHGLRAGRWHPFGDPPPRTQPTGGPGGSGVFANNGDAFFASGAVTDSAFPLEHGLDVEVDGRMAFTGRLHQEFGIALYAERHPDSVLASGQAPALAEFRVDGPSADGPGAAWISTLEWRQVVPMPEHPEEWHSYALEVLADGTVALIVDGRLSWRSPMPLERHGGAVRIGLGFASLETELLHGRLAVYAPPRYELPRATGGGASPP